MTQKINLRRIKRDGIPPPKKISKKFKKNALDIIRVLFKDESITIDIVP